MTTRRTRSAIMSQTLDTLQGMMRSGPYVELAVEPMVDQMVLVPELETDWAPDPWAWRLSAGSRSFERAYQAAAAEYPLWLNVPFPGGKRRRVPLLGPWTRAVHTSVAHLVAADENGSLREGVHGFRTDEKGALEHYRSALARRRDYEHALVQTYDYVLTTDVREFFSSITDSTLAETVLAQLNPSIRPVATAAMRLVSSQVGYPVPEGYNAARAIASLVMRPVDAVIDRPFSRWIDDYKIFSADRLALEHALDTVAAAVREIGLELNTAKSTISESSRLDTNYVGSLDCSTHDHEEVEGLADTLRSEHPNEKRVRFLVRLATEQSDDRVLAPLARYSVKIPDVAMPRIAWLIGTQPDHPTTQNIVDALLDMESDYAEWRFLRLSYALWYLPTSAVAELVPRLLLAAERWPSTEGVIARVLARHAPQALRSLSLVERLPSRSSELVIEEMNGSSMPGPPLRSYL